MKVETGGQVEAEVMVALHLRQMLVPQDIILILKNQPFQVQHGFSTMLIMEQGEKEATVETGGVKMVLRALVVLAEAEA